MSGWDSGCQAVLSEPNLKQHLEQRFQSGTGAELASLCWCFFQAKINGIKATFSSLSLPPCSNLDEILYLDGLRSLWWTWHLCVRVQINKMTNTCFFPSTPILSLNYIMDTQIKIRLHWGGDGYRAKDYLQLLLPEPAVSIVGGVNPRVCLAQGNGLVTHNPTFLPILVWLCFSKFFLCSSCIGDKCINLSLYPHCPITVFKFFICAWKQVSWNKHIN